jgi:DNA-binding transcriptional LysR family regulator
MERSQRLSDFWNWLPTFRAVAEAEHLPTAAQTLHISPSAISRTVRLLEEELGHELFDRVGRNIVLNDAGQLLLNALRDAMRTLDEGIGRIETSAFVGKVHISVPGPFMRPLLAPAIKQARALHPELIPQLVGAPAERVEGMLLRGTLDLAIVSTPNPHPSLKLERLLTLSHGVYCGAAHPLSGIARIRKQDLSAHGFVAPVAGPDGLTPDQWPEDLARRVDVRVARMHVAAELCAEGGLLCVLPDLVGQGAGLHRLPWERCAATVVYLLRRRPLTLKSSADALASLIHDVAATLPNDV